ncbi:hypothetical protein P171DRAFT_526782 [Karstenula rhodostoma CBS 690.94]|uniref:Rhodopsin domain-containing protein n=1 Tax=Karstenula rhodostoma CBS 690.94 TaxID=1392251 RepID=A0A9P4P597_9PLEO|nr:hypothetical protein P171DRAFT_526782 [Karstenula rhodostoma CBS 690.94]
MHPHSREELDNKWKIIRHAAFLSALIVIIVTIRIASSLLQWKRLSVAEYLLLFATAGSLALNGASIFITDRAGLGHHIGNVSRAQLVYFLKFYFSAALLIPTCFATAKLSLLWLLHRIFANSWFRNVVRVLAGIIIAWWVASIVQEVRICYPVQTRWEGTCKGKHSLGSFLILPIPWIVTDWLILLTPLPVLWNSIDARRSRATQVGLLTLFGLGIVTCCISIRRYTVQLNMDMHDLTFSLVEPTLWQMIDISTTICCAALPGSTHVLRRMLPVDLLKQAVDWVERTWKATKQSSCTTRNLTAGDAEANLPPVSTLQHPQNSLSGAVSNQA